MREMCTNFLVDSDTNITDTPTVRTAAPRLDENMGVLDCNTCVLQSIGLAQAFVPFQPNANTMNKEQSLVCGTAFADLVQPYVQGSNLKRKN